MSASRGSRASSSAPWRAIANGKQPQSDPKTNSSTQTLKNLSEYKLGAYIRLSPSDEIRAEGSLISHPQRIEDFVAFKNSQQLGWGKIIEFYTDKDFSGKDMNRPAFIRMCKDIKEGKINAVIATELSRLSRSVKDFCQFWDFLKIHKAKFFALKENFDSSTPMGELMVVQAISFAQFERSAIVTRLKDGARARASRGLAQGGPRMLGYDPDPNRTCHLIVNETERPYVELIFKKYLELGTLSKLQDFLNANGYRTKSYVSKRGRQMGGKRWTSRSLHGVLTNARYIGKREINKDNRCRHPNEFSDSEAYRVVTAQWSAIISIEIFNEVQSLLERNKQFTRRYVHNYRLSGLVYCGNCGVRLIGKSGTGKNGKYFYYGHMRQMTTFDDRHLRRCPVESVSAPGLEEAIISRLTFLAQDRGLVTELAKLSEQTSQNQLAQISSLAASLEQERRQTKQLVDSLMEDAARTQAETTKLTYFEKIERETDRLHAIETQIEQLKKDKLHSKENLIDLEGVFSLLRSFNKDFGLRPAHEQHEILKDFVKRILINSGGPHLVEYHGAPREDLLSVGAPHFLSEIRDIELQNGDMQAYLGVRRFGGLFHHFSSLFEQESKKNRFRLCAELSGVWADLAPCDPSYSR